MDSFDIVILTDPGFKNDVIELAKTTHMKINVWCLDFTTIFQAACSRLFIFDYPEVQNYEKILYLDTDILIKQDLAPLFQLELSDVLYGLECGTIGSPSFGNMFFDFKRVDHSTPGINSGTLLFKNSLIIRDLFSRIRGHIKAFTDSGATIPYCMDQPFINYHAISDNLYDNTLLNPYISLYEGDDKVNNYETSSICHFSYPIGNFDHKYIRMKKFLDKLVHTKVDSTRIPEILGKTYSWNEGTGYFKFKESHLETSWGNGTYNILTRNTIQIYWQNFYHSIKMNEDYTSYICLCVYPLDFVFHKGFLVETLLICKDSASKMIDLDIPHKTLECPLESLSFLKDTVQKILVFDYSEFNESHFKFIQPLVKQSRAVIICGTLSETMKYNCLLYGCILFDRDAPFFMERFHSLYSRCNLDLPTDLLVCDPIDAMSGEKFQLLATVTLGTLDDFVYNPVIKRNLEKCLQISDIPPKWNNPSIVFCYSHCLEDFSRNLASLQNPCVLIAGNSDYNVPAELCSRILGCEKILHFFCQNLLEPHPRASLLPIGFANTMWSHGSHSHFSEVNRNPVKQKDIFCSFKVETNSAKRIPCKGFAERNRIVNQTLHHKDYLRELSLHRFCLCPEGNGIDSHRFWEALWVKTIPIVTRSGFTEQLQEMGLPCVLIDSWNRFDIKSLPDPSSFSFDICKKQINFQEMSKKILRKVNVNRLSVAYAFIGPLPSYSLETVQQLRLFFDGDIYFIVTDISHPYINLLVTVYKVTIVNYKDVVDKKFNSLIEKNLSKFHIADGLKMENRDKLFIYAFERFYVLKNCMEKYNLQNVFFMELDNLVYEDPSRWLSALSKNDFAYMLDHNDRGASGVSYIKNSEILSEFLEFCNQSIESALPISQTPIVLCEMMILYKFWKANPNRIQILPTFWKDDSIPDDYSKGFSNYGSIFDAAALGIYLGGMHPYHTLGIIKKYVKNSLSILDFTRCDVKWEADEKKRMIPFVSTGTQWIRVNNLHIHTKRLSEFMSNSLKEDAYIRACA
jgi:hypothetical protein